MSFWNPIVSLLTAALSLLGFVHADPSLSQATQDQIIQVAQQAVTQATNAVPLQQSSQTTNSPRSSQAPAPTATATTDLEQGALAGNLVWDLSGQKKIPANQLTDCQAGSHVVDLEGNPSGAIESATHVYNGNCDLLVGATPSNFVALDYYYGKDASNVWLLANPSEEGSPPWGPMPGADPATFTLISDPQSLGAFGYSEYFSNIYTKDKTHVYVFGQLLDGADPATFAIHFPSGTTTCQFDAFDSSHKYYRGELALQTGCEPLQ